MELDVSFDSQYLNQRLVPFLLNPTPTLSGHVLKVNTDHMQPEVRGQQDEIVLRARLENTARDTGSQRAAAEVITRQRG